MPTTNHFDGDILAWWDSCMKEIVKEQRRNLDGLIIYTAWGIWSQNNNRIFNGMYNTVTQVVESIIAMKNPWTIM
ncbi:hypothetical protein DAI22_04g094900 [Oryza sativa Japonica Group]|nr:hypothetical protein DAI22_04g094900 [Oryza sativa Japonica Group]